MGSLGLIDAVIVVLYLLGILGLGLWTSKRGDANVNGYFLASKSLKWPVIGTALFASNISTVHLVGLAASGFKDGLVWGNFELLAVITLIVLGLIFAPFYFKNKISTLPEFLEKRYDKRARFYLAILGIIGALFMHIGVSLYAGAVVFQQFFNINVYVSIFVISLITSVYTIVGGLKSVVVTETIQTILLVGGASVLTLLGFLEISEMGIQSWDGLKAIAKPDQLSLIPSGGNQSNISFLDIILGYPVLGIWYWCADQTIVQRVLGAKTLTDAKQGPLFAGLIKLLPLFIFVLPGVFAYVLYADQITNPNHTFPVLINQLMPVGLKGVMAAALLAALMSTVAAALNSAGSLVAIDIFKSLNPNISENKQIVIGKITVVVVMIIAISWSPLIAKFESIFEAINTLLTVVCPPITTVFVWGVFWKRGNSQAAIATFIGGFLLGLFVFVLDFPFVGEEKLFSNALGISFMMQAWLLFVCSSIIYITTSLLTPAPDYKRVNNYIFSFEQERHGKEERSDNTNRYALILIVVLVLIYFLIG